MDNNMGPECKEKYNKGFTILEVLVAISLLSIGFMALTATLWSGSRSTQTTNFGDLSVMATQDTNEMLSVIPIDHNSLDGNAYALDKAPIEVEWEALDATDGDSDGTPDFTTIAVRVFSQGQLRAQSYYRRQIN